MGGLNKVEVINSKALTVRSTGPFSGLVICVTGLSKEGRKQVMEATERLGGQYSTSLHPQCTHLVVQISFLNTFFSGKFEHALKQGSRNGILLVKLGWFVDSVNRNVRLSESLYAVKGIGEHVTPEDELNWIAESTASKSSCLPAGFHEAKKTDMIEKSHVGIYRRDPSKSINSMLYGHTMYIDSDISVELQNKVLEAASKEGATVVDRWFVGCGASHVVCEGNSVHRYIGSSDNIITPLWVLKTAKDRTLHRLVHMSTDLAMQIGTVLENAHNANVGEENNVANSTHSTPSVRRNASHQERQQIVHLAKTGVRNRRSHCMQGKLF
ncbi:3beta-hydroxysteroid-dehydrogenase/decarboxylase isoform 1 [Hibiscus syriacus]|uniref:3beta-hydroxysteroid-dehydrogenase/decarboxylase isoform 1 n=1 Tax=Hibiscus syriacus TaxID=106335 RepID=A0A6A2WYC9_HIBSY|nr:3beta-hydroxysteroid-dehydrogenase/decarboxylase isoform 1 [Hibiscus syriacus]